MVAEMNEEGTGGDERREKERELDEISAELHDDKCAGCRAAGCPPHQLEVA